MLAIDGIGRIHTCQEQAHGVYEYIACHNETEHKEVTHRRDEQRRQRKHASDKVHKCLRRSRMAMIDGSLDSSAIVARAHSWREHLHVMNCSLLWQVQELQTRQMFLESKGPRESIAVLYLWILFKSTAHIHAHLPTHVSYLAHACTEKLSSGTNTQYLLSEW